MLKGLALTNWRCSSQATGGQFVVSASEHIISLLDPRHFCINVYCSWCAAADKLTGYPDCSMMLALILSPVSVALLSKVRQRSLEFVQRLCAYELRIILAWEPNFVSFIVHIFKEIKRLVKTKIERWDNHLGIQTCLWRHAPIHKKSWYSWSQFNHEIFNRDAFNSRQLSRSFPFLARAQLV